MWESVKGCFNETAGHCWPIGIKKTFVPGYRLGTASRRTCTVQNICEGGAGESLHRIPSWQRLE